MYDKFHEFKTCKERVLHILETSPKCRDDDKRLLAYYQWHELKLEDKMTKEEFYQRTQFHKLPSHETITRVRRKLQETFAELRGETYNARHKQAESVRTQIKTNWEINNNL